MTPPSSAVMIASLAEATTASSERSHRAVRLRPADDGIKARLSLVQEPFKRVLGAACFVRDLEKSWRFGKSLGLACGVALMVLALFVPSHPQLVPGLHVDGRMGTMPMEP